MEDYARSAPPSVGAERKKLKINAVQIAQNRPSQDNVSNNFLTSNTVICKDSYAWKTLIAPRHHRLARSEKILKIKAAQMAGTDTFKKNTIFPPPPTRR